MSRFYDVLREASRSLQKPGDHPGEAEWAALGIDAIEVPPVLNNPEPSDGAAPPVAEAPWVVSPAEKILNAISPPQNGSLGIPAKVTLDQEARLIPHAANSAVVEYYRRLRTKIMHEQESKPFRSLVVTSPGPREGKTVTVLNLAWSYAMLPSFKVLVVDGDLRNGSLGKLLGVNDHPGLSNLIDGSASVEEVVLKSDETPMHFMVRGNSKYPPAELLHSPQLGDQFRRIAEQFGLVLVDSPPVNLTADAHLLAASCDAVLLVTRAFATTRSALERAVHDLEPFRVIGTVLNGGTNAGSLHRASRVLLRHND